MNVLYGASPDMQTTGKSIADGLNAVIRRDPRDRVRDDDPDRRRRRRYAGVAERASTLAHTLSPTGPAVGSIRRAASLGQISGPTARPTRRTAPSRSISLAQQLDLIRQEVAYPQVERRPRSDAHRARLFRCSNISARRRSRRLVDTSLGPGVLTVSADAAGLSLSSHGHGRQAIDFTDVSFGAEDLTRGG